MCKSWCKKEIEHVSSCEKVSLIKCSTMLSKHKQHLSMIPCMKYHKVNSRVLRREHFDNDYFGYPLLQDQLHIWIVSVQFNTDVNAFQKTEVKVRISRWKGSEVIQREGTCAFFTMYMFHSTQPVPNHARTSCGPTQHFRVVDARAAYSMSTWKWKW